MRIPLIILTVLLLLTVMMWPLEVSSGQREAIHIGADTTPPAVFTPTSPVFTPTRLAIYYGWPSLVNNADGDVNQAAQEFAKFDLVVFKHHTDTESIISELMLITSSVQVYGYVDMGARPITTTKQYVVNWKKKGVTGIFWDNAGYDYGVDRSRQNTLIDYTHSQGLKVFVNAWNPNDVFADDPDPTHLQAGDWYLAESHPVANGHFSDLNDWWNKSQLLDTYRAQTGVQIATISTGSDSYSGWANQAVFRQALWANYLFAFDGFGFTNSQYSASGSGANRLRALPPVATNIGTTYLGPPQTTTANSYTRLTDKGTIFVFGDSNSGGGIFRGGACDTTSLGDKIWPTCAASPPAQSSPFGPRQKASESFRYDWHRGVDIPQPLGEPVYAPMDGVVRVAGTHTAYSDMLVQIRHRDRSPYLYSNALHMHSVVVSEGDLVTVGDLVGYSGEGASGFDHIHFEFRDGCLYQECNRNPWGYLPYTDTQPLTPTLRGFNASGGLLLLDMQTAPDQLDLDGLDLTWGANTVQLSLNDINSTTNRDAPHLLDHPLVRLNDGVHVCLFPARFKTSSSEAGYRVLFRDLDTNATTGSAAIRDLNGTGPTQTMTPNLPTLTLEPAAQQVMALPGSTVHFTHTLQNNGTETLSVTVSAQSAQNNALKLSQTNLTLDAGESQAIPLTVTLAANFPEGVGDCILLEVDAGTTQRLIALNSVITTSPISRSISLQSGWNHISLPLDPITTPLTASDVCNQIDSQGGSAVEIDRWHNGGWVGHICGLSFNDFALELGSDYFIKSNTSSSWNIEGYQVTEAVPLSLQIGWNSIGIPHTDAYTASSLCDKINAQGVTAVEIDRWHNGGWDGHICGQSFNNFAIEPGKGYFVKASSSGIVTPSRSRGFALGK